MRLSIRREGDGWDRAHVLRFDWQAVSEEFSASAGPSVRGALHRKAPRRPEWDHPERGPVGRLADSIDWHRESAESMVRLKFSAHVGYAAYVVHGTRAHGIDPREREWLHWVDPEGNHFRRHVEHPGARSNDFADTVLHEQQPAVVEHLARAVERNVKE